VESRAVILALAASCFTALASVAQRQAAAPAPGDLSLSVRLIGYLLKRPVWFLGIACMMLGFVFQFAALKAGPLSVVQPVIAGELVLVFGCIALKDHSRVGLRDWIAAIGMVLGLAVLLSLSDPHGGTDRASASRWVFAAGVTGALAIVVVIVAYLPSTGRERTGSGRKAALLGVAAAIGFGFVAAVVKELSTQLSQGISGIFLDWSLYALLLSGAASMFLASNAFQAGSLAASQPGLTLVDPLVASALGVLLFGDRFNLQAGPASGELLALVVVVCSVVLLSRSPLVQGAKGSGPQEAPRPESQVGAPALLAQSDSTPLSGCGGDVMDRMHAQHWTRGKEPMRAHIDRPLDELTPAATREEPGK
jgi:drug/metabolite transporter (DMT)-like permease